MAKLSAFRVDSAKIEQGEWISPGLEYDDMEVHVRGFTDAYFESQNLKLHRAARAFNGDTARVPMAVQRDIRIEALITHILLDVRGISTDEGTPVTLAQFCDVLRNPDYADLVMAVQKAAGQVGRNLTEDKKDAAGN